MKKLATCFLFTVITCYAYPQSGKLDSLFNSRDTTAILDSLLKDFDQFLDSLSTPKSFFSVSIGAGTGYFSFEDKNSSFVNTQKKLIVAPSIGYYHKSGLGLSASAAMINDEGGLNIYQYAFSPSYDLIKRKFSTGISYTRYLSKDSLDFYATPIQNELYAYFSYKKWWVRPTISFSYGWGSKAEYEKRKPDRLAALLSQSRRYYIVIKNVEYVRDFSMTVSVRKDFDWYSVLGKNDNITLTPVLMLNSGTQNFGFNTSYSYSFNTVRTNSLPSNQEITDNTQFGLHSASFVLRGSYLKGRFIFQAQTLFDYYLQELLSDDPRLNTVFSATMGYSF
jgi:hypothetical protein